MGHGVARWGTMDAMTHPLDDAVTLERRGDLAVAHTHEGWMNMVGPYGGITAATVMAAIVEHPDRIGDPVALTVNYAAPIAEGEWSLDVRVVRTNRSNQHWLVVAEQGGEVVVTATAVTSRVSGGWGDQELDIPQNDGPDAYPIAKSPLPLRWLDRYDMRFVSGGFDAIPSESSRSVLWLGHTEPRPWDHVAVACAVDAVFPRGFLRIGTSTAFGTVTMTTYFHSGAQELAAMPAPVLMDTTAARYANGYYDQSVRLFSSSGALIATSHQAVYFKPGALG